MSEGTNACVHIVSVAAGLTMQSVIAEPHTVTRYCATVMKIPLCHTFIRILLGKCLVLEMYPRVLSY